MEDFKALKKEILSREFKKFGERKIMLELQIALQRELDPEEMSAKKPLQYNNAGQPISYEKIKRKEHIVILEKELEDIVLVLKIIKDLE